MSVAGAKPRGGGKLWGYLRTSISVSRDEYGITAWPVWSTVIRA